MTIFIQILGIIEIIICCIAFFFKKKWQFLICLLIYNAITFVQYILQGFYTETIITAICIVRIIVFYIYDIKNKKPNIWVCGIFFALMIGGSVITFENYFSLLALGASLIGTYAIIQDNMLVLRLAYIVCSILLIINFVFTGLYTNIIAEAISLVASVISVFKYHVLTKREENQNID